MSMPVVVNQFSAQQAAGTSVVVNTPGVSVGNILVVFTSPFKISTGATTTNVPTDSTGGSNTWTQRATTVGSATFQNVMAVADTMVLVAPTTVTASAAGTPSQVSAVVLEIAGINQASWFDVAVQNAQTSATPGIGTITAAANTIIVTCLSHDGVITTLAPPAGFTQGPEIESVANVPFTTGWQVNKGQQLVSYNPTYVVGASRDCCIATASYIQNSQPLLPNRLRPHPFSPGIAR